MRKTALQSFMPQQVDVLTIALGAAALLHVFIIFGVSFKPFLDEMRTPPAVEVILVQENDSERPEEADYLAAFSQDGGGDTDETTRPSTPFASQQDFNTDGVAANPEVASAPKASDPTADAMLTTVFSDRDILTQEEKVEQAVVKPNESVVVIQEDLDIAALSAEIDRQQEQFAKRPRKKWLTARTHEQISANYMYRWVEKVERIGNLNYPDQVRRQQLQGAVLVTVGIYKNGDIESIFIKESSGFQVLDDAAKRIVSLAGPFEPLTGKLAEETDILYITRTWEFQSSNSVISY
ncbi:MAG: TonB family protein [Gammaproteobacteria bacterium]|nr:TonB family protein [Gammaproteobacteria bacterium]